MTKHDIREYRIIAREAQLDNVRVINKYSIDDLKIIFNGIGSDRFPQKVRNLLDKLNPTLMPVAMIHDVEYHEANGKMAKFTESNTRFKKNGYKIAKYRYCFLDPRRYIVMNQARRFGNFCQLFGWSAWTSPCECAICKAKRRKDKKK